MEKEQGATQFFDNIWNHPRTSAMGLLLGVVTVSGALSQQGISLGRAGTGTVVQLVSGIATALLGLLARDPGADGSIPGGTAGGTAKLGAWMLIALLIPLPWLAGCNSTTVARQIVNWTPALDAAVAAVDGCVGTMEPADSAVLTQVTNSFNAASKLVTAEAQAYLASPNASQLAKLQTAVVTLEQQVNTALLAAAKITNPASQQKALNGVNAVSTAVLAILALVQSVSSDKQVAQMASQAPVKLASVEGWLNRGQATEMVARHYGEPASLARQQVAQAEESVMQAGF